MPCACILNKQVRRQGGGRGRGGAGTGDTCLLLGDVYGLVEDDPCGGLVTRRHRGGAVVRHVMLRVRQKFAHPETFNFYGLPCAIHTVDNVNVAPGDSRERRKRRERGRARMHAYGQHVCVSRDHGADRRALHGFDVRALLRTRLMLSRVTARSHLRTHDTRKKRRRLSIYLAGKKLPTMLRQVFRKL